MVDQESPRLEGANEPEKPYGLLAEFESAADLYHACEQVRDAGFSRWDAHTPFPVHGLNKAMGIAPSRLPYLVFVMGLSGAVGAMLLQWWTSAVDYKVIIAAKPFFSWQAFIPVTFEVMVLFAAGTAVFGMLFINRLPMWHHALLKADRFCRASDDRFYISIEASDPRYEREKTEALLQKAGAKHVEVVQP